MSKTPKPIVHARDHEHGGADTVRIVWESTGEAGTGGGLQFDTYPQAGQWLYVETDGTDESPSGYGVEVYDTSGNGISLSTSAGGGIELTTVGGGNGILLQTAGEADIVVWPGVGGYIYLRGLPSSDPGITGVLWVDSSGFLRRSL